MLAMHGRYVATAVVAAAVAAYLVRRLRSRTARRRVLITGASGYLGQHLTAVLHEAEPLLSVHVAYGGLETYESDVIGTVASATKLDLADAAQVRALVDKVQPDCIVHLAAVSSPACQRRRSS